MVTTDEMEGSGMSRFARIAMIAGLSAASLFLLGVATGIIAAWINMGVFKPKAVIAAVAALPLGLLCGWLAYRNYRGMMAGPVAAKVRTSRRMLLISIGMGALAGAVVATGSVGDEPMDLFSNDPMPLWAALVLVAVWAVATPIISLFWWRNIDEHEKQAYSRSALIALNIYVLATPTWWFLWRAGQVGPVEPMVMFLVVVTAWGLGWMKGRYA